MGKYALLITVAALGGITLMMYQSGRTSMNTEQRQAERQGKVIARQIARTGYNAVLADGRAASTTSEDLEEVISAVGTISGDYEGGTYESWLEKISPSAYRAKSVGTFTIGENTITHRIGQSYDKNTMPLQETPVVENPSTLNVSFVESMAGYCSAIYLKRILPNVAPEDQPEPELIFAPGNNRDGASTEYARTIVPGTKLNFILAVDADGHCERRGESIDITDDFFERRRNSFTQDVTDIENVHEAPYALIQDHSSGGWRIAYEDLVFDEAKLWDIKKNSYPDSDGGWDSEAETYGGDGWETDGSDMFELEDFGNLPDFSDQVIDVEVVPDPDNGPTPRTFVEAAKESSVTVSSTKDLSNVVWQYADGTAQKKEGLSGHTFTIPHSSNNPITDVWVKSGKNQTDPNDPQAPIGGRGTGEYHPVTTTG